MVKRKVEGAFMRTDSYGREWEYYKTDVGGKMRYHYEKHCPQTEQENRAFFLITAYQPEQDAAAHKQQTDLLAKDIRAAGLGVIRVLGCYQDTAQKREITAESFFVPLPVDFDVQSFLQHAVSLCKAYAQETVLINIPEHTDFLLDNVLYSDFVTQDGAANMMEQLAHLSSPTFRHMTANLRHRTEQTNKSRNQSGVLLIEQIQTAIAQKKQISCNYLTYRADCTTERKYPENLTINPYDLAYKYGKYYLLGALDISDQMLSWRVDRLCDLEILGSPCREIPLLKSIRSSGGISAYVDSQPELCGGETETFKLQCANDAIDEIVDVFGLNFEPAPEQQTNDDPETVILQVKATRESMKAWAITHADSVVIISPEDMKDSIQDALHIASKRYALNGKPFQIKMMRAESLEEAVHLTKIHARKRLSFRAAAWNGKKPQINTALLKEVPDLTSLGLVNCTITDADFLKAVPLLTDLRLLRCEFPVSALRDVPHLEKLIVTDANEISVDILRELKQLRILKIYDSPHFTQDDAAALQKILPDCKIIL